MDLNASPGVKQTESKFTIKNLQLKNKTYNFFITRMSSFFPLTSLFYRHIE